MKESIKARIEALVTKMVRRAKTTGIVELSFDDLLALDPGRRGMNYEPLYRAVTRRLDRRLIAEKVRVRQNVLALRELALSKLTTVERKVLGVESIAEAIQQLRA
jgi:hypothetical protein